MYFFLQYPLVLFYSLSRLFLLPNNLQEPSPWAYSTDQVNVLYFVVQIFQIKSSWTGQEHILYFKIISLLEKEILYLLRTGSNIVSPLIYICTCKYFCKICNASLLLQKCTLLTLHLVETTRPKLVFVNKQKKSNTVSICTHTYMSYLRSFGIHLSNTYSTVVTPCPHTVKNNRWLVFKFFFKSPFSSDDDQL